MIRVLYSLMNHLLLLAMLVCDPFIIFVSQNSPEINLHFLSSYRLSHPRPSDRAIAISVHGLTHYMHWLLKETDAAFLGEHQSSVRMV